MSPLRVEDWEIIADRLSKAGWSWGWVSAVDSKGRTIWIVDAHRDGPRKNSCIKAQAGGRQLLLRGFFPCLRSSDQLRLPGG